MNEIYIVDGQKYDVNPERKDEFLQKFPNAVLFEEPGKITPTTPGAVVEDTAAPDIPNTELQSENTSLDLPDPEELTPEEKRNVPFGTAQYLHRNNKKFIYLLIREMTDVNTTQITKVVKIMKKQYIKLFNSFEKNGYIEHERHFF